MSREEIIAMAKEARISELGLNIDGSTHLLALFERFAALVAAKEREACAQIAQATVCDTHIPTGIRIHGTKAAQAIRARSAE